MAVTTTIIPIFIVIFAGWALKKKGFIPTEFVGPANRLAYYLAIPAMVFNSISKGSFTQQFNVMVLLIGCICVIGAFCLAYAFAKIADFSRNRMGTFVQCSFHGNLGFIGLAVAFYYLGHDGLARAGILTGFIMVLQNLLSVIILQVHSGETSIEKGTVLRLVVKVLVNPVILSALGGIVFSASGYKLPLIIDRTLHILSGLGLPMALLLIGASLSFKAVQSKILPLTISFVIKLFLLPGMGFLLYNIFHIAGKDYLPGLILLASPTATLAYVMAGEMNSDTDFAGSAISLSTLISSVSFTLWIFLAS
jgi:predicted permease